MFDWIFIEENHKQTHYKDLKNNTHMHIYNLGCHSHTSASYCLTITCIGDYLSMEKRQLHQNLWHVWRDCPAFDTAHHFLCPTCLVTSGRLQFHLQPLCQLVPPLVCFGHGQRVLYHCYRKHHFFPASPVCAKQTPGDGLKSVVWVAFCLKSPAALAAKHNCLERQLANTKPRWHTHYFQTASWQMERDKGQSQAQLAQLVHSDSNLWRGSLC